MEHKIELASESSLRNNTDRFDECKLKALKEKYSQEMRNDASNPIKTCLKLIFESAIEKNPDRRIILALELSDYLTSDKGVINLFLAVVDFDTSSQRVTTHNQRFSAIAKIITCLPKLSMPYINYCDNIFKQLKFMISCANPNYSSLACIIVKSMFESPYATNSNLDKIIIQPMCAALKQDMPEFLTLQDAVSAICNLVQNHFPSEHFVDVFSHLFYIYMTIKKTISSLKGTLLDCLVNILNSLEAGPACWLLDKTVFHDKNLGSRYNWSAGEEGILINFNNQDNNKIVEDDDENLDNDEICAMVVNLIDGCKNESLIVEFFFHFQSKMWMAQSGHTKQRSALLIEPLLSRVLDEDSDKIDFLTSIVTNQKRSLELICKTLMNYVDSVRSHVDRTDDTLLVVNKSVNDCLSILEVLLVSSKSSDTCSRNAVKVILEKMKSALTDTKTSNAKLITDIDSLLSKLITSSYPVTGNRRDERLDYSQQYKKALMQLNDKSVPVRVHGLVTFKQMIMANDEQAVQNIPALISLVESSLADQDPYVFLACINLMSEMCLRNTGGTLYKLIELYSKQDLDVQQRLNVCEVLVRLVRQLNATTPYYAGQIISALLNGTRDENELVRVSSLSSLGEVCRGLGNSLGKYMIDVLRCVEDIVKTDVIHVQCAAISLLRLALMGIDDKFKTESVQRELKSIYALLKRVREHTLDDTLCLQADLALDEIDRLARELLGLGQVPK